MENSFERPVSQEEGSRLFKEMRDRLADPDSIPVVEKSIEIEAITEKIPSQYSKQAEKPVTSVTPRKKSSVGSGWLNDWQNRQEADNERRFGTDSEAVLMSFKEQERIADEKRGKNEQVGHEHGNN